MGGPIVRTGTTPKFWQNWENIFGDKKSGKASSKSAKKKPSTKAATGKSVKKAAGKKKK